eukprot:2198101-Prymnesium_polylepis.1
MDAMRRTGDSPLSACPVPEGGNVADSHVARYQRGRVAPFAHHSSARRVDWKAKLRCPSRRGREARSLTQCSSSTGGSPLT